MATIRYTNDHEWIRLDGDIGTVGISDYAQTQLGDVVYVELPPVGKKIAKGDEAAIVESVKAASEVYARSPARSSLSTPTSKAPRQP
jgi:glycine cleavage system H protein